MLPISDDNLPSQMAILAASQKEKNDDVDAMFDLAVSVSGKKRRFKTGELVKDSEPK